MKANNGFSSLCLDNLAEIALRLASFAELQTFALTCKAAAAAVAHAWPAIEAKHIVLHTATGTFHTEGCARPHTHSRRDRRKLKDMKFLDREKAPSVERQSRRLDGRILWCTTLFGLFHSRGDEPAVMSRGGTQWMWYKRGWLHRCVGGVYKHTVQNEKGRKLWHQRGQMQSDGDKPA